MKIAEDVAMPIRNILVPICPEVGFDRQLEAALSLARRAEGHISAVYIRPDPVTAVASILEVATSAGVTIDRIDRDNCEAQAAAHARFEAWRVKHGLASDDAGQSLGAPFARWSEQVGRLETMIARCGRLSDLIVLNLPNPGEAATEQAFDAAVFDTARPTILLPTRVPDDLLRHVIVAWNGSLEATRALAGAMTLLCEAERVSVFSAPDYAEDSARNLDLAEFLSWHGIQAGCFAPNAEERSVGAALLRVATESSATMLVMGGYTHSRVRQMVLGGVTSHVLRHAEIPVLMMH